MIDIKAFIIRNLMKVGIDVNKMPVYQKYRLMKMTEQIVKESNVYKLVNASYTDRYISQLKEKIDPKSKNNEFTIILFSYNRAFQVYSLLKSLLDNVKTTKKLNINVIYRASNEDHNHSYNQLIEIFKADGIKFIQQKSRETLKSDILGVLKTAKSEQMLFLVDDIVITNPINLDQMLSFNSRFFIPSLRLGKNINYCYTQQQPQALPPFVDSKIFKNEGDISGLNFWKWREGAKWKNFDLDWSYVVSVDGNIFNREEMIIMVESINFNLPNVFENELYKQFSDLLNSRIGICFDISKMVNLPINKVHVEGSFNIAGESSTMTTDYLLNQWNLGMMMDYKGFEGHVSKSPHEEIQFKIIKRK